LLKAFQQHLERLALIWADGGYDSEAFIYAAMVRIMLQRLARNPAVYLQGCSFTFKTRS
jgi:hypothetical protein